MIGRDSVSTDYSVDDEEEYAEEETKLSQAINKIRRMYTNTLMTGDGDRIGFETLLNEIDTAVSQNEHKKNSDIELLRTELAINNRERDLKIKDWRQRYEKLQNRWNECMVNMDKLQEEKEQLRKQRDELLLKKKVKHSRDTPISNGVIEEKRVFFISLLRNMLEAMITSLSADTGTIFVFDPKPKELISLVLIPPVFPEPDNDDDAEYLRKRSFPEQIRPPVKAGKSIAGTVFQTGDCINILDAQKDERLYRAIDQVSGYKTKAILCFPIFSVKNNTVVGVIEIINKRNSDDVFSVQDEARMAEYSIMVSHVMDTPGLRDLGFNFADIYGSAANMNEEVDDTDPEMAKPMKRMASYLNVKRSKLRTTNQSNLTPRRQSLDTSTTEEGSEDSASVISQKPTTIVPKDIDNYIKKLELCWRKAVGESAQFQNRIVMLEKELHQKHTFKFNVEKNNQELNNRIIALEKELMKISHEFSMQKDKWTRKEIELRNEIEMIQRTNQKLFVDHAKAGNEEIVKNIIVPTNGNTPTNKSIQLPYIDLKSQRKKIVLNLSEHGQISPKSIESGIILNNPSNGFVLHSTKENEMADNPPTFRSRGAQPRELFMDVFVFGPSAMCILNKNYRVWRANEKFCDMLDCTEQNLLGLLLSDISIGVDFETLPRLLQFDVVQGLGICKPKPSSDELSLRRNSMDDLALNTTNDSLTKTYGDTKSKRTFFKVNVQIAVIGPSGQKYQTFLKQGRGVVKAPFYALTFTRQSKPTLQTAK
jgi:PAS domain-containing protein